MANHIVTKDDIIAFANEERLVPMANHIVTKELTVNNIGKSYSNKGI